jgi:hypothetical protein
MDILIQKKRLEKEEYKNKIQLKLKNNLVKKNFPLLKTDGVLQKIPSFSLCQEKQTTLLKQVKKSFQNSNFSRDFYLAQKFKNEYFFVNRFFSLPQESKEISFSLENNFEKEIKKETKKLDFVSDFSFISPLENSQIDREKSEKSKFTFFNKLNFLVSFRFWKISLASGVVCGMLMMTFVHYKLGGVVLAQIEEKENLIKKIEKIEEKKDELYFSNEENFFSREKISDEKKQNLEKKMREMVVGHPIENMIPYILEQDYNVAIYMIAIAKQESNWGDRVPTLNEKDCYNYWGYRENRELMGSAGHTCFDSREDAVKTVGKRLDDLLYKYNRQSAEKLIVWKCGSSCEGHDQEGVNRWIKTVDDYYKELVK